MKASKVGTWQYYAKNKFHTHFPSLLRYHSPRRLSGILKMLDVILNVTCMFLLRLFIYLKASSAHIFFSLKLHSIVWYIMLSNIWIPFLLSFFCHPSSTFTSCGCLRKRSYNNSLFSVLIFLSAVVLITKRDLNSEEMYIFICCSFSPLSLARATLQGEIFGLEIKETLYLIFARVLPVTSSFCRSFSLSPSQRLVRWIFVWTWIYIKENRSEIPWLRFFCLVLRLILFEFLFFSSFLVLLGWEKGHKGNENVIFYGCKSFKLSTLLGTKSRALI